jgi:XrtJ-associated TM-motif-TM protein
MTMKRILSYIGLALMLGTALNLRAQGGCVDSPEDPTLALALVAGAGALVAGVWRGRHRK